jgi:hypothetical protein
MLALVHWIGSEGQYFSLWLVSLLYLTIDFYPQVPSLLAIWKTPPFWMLWLVFSFLNTIAFSIIDEKSHSAVLTVVNAPLVAAAAIQFLSTIGVYSVLQSFSLQFAGKKVVDIEELVARFRTSALQAAAAKRATLDGRTARKLAEELRSVYRSNFQALSEDYGLVMSLAKMPRDRIISGLERYNTSEGAERDALLNELTTRMAVADRQGVREILAKRRYG